MQKQQARLFHKKSELVMKTTKQVAAGSELFNTYGDLPDAELLRKYGFVDGDNPHNVVEIEREIVVRAISDSIENFWSYLEVAREVGGGVGMEENVGTSGSSSTGSSGKRR